MKGEITRIQKRKSKSGKEFWLLSTDGKNYGIWDKSLFDDLKREDTIEFCWIENRGYKVITSLKKVLSKDDQIIRDELSIICIATDFWDWHKSKEKEKISSRDGQRV